MTYYKILTEDLKHYNMQYKEGLNVDVEEFNPEPECQGGLFFSDADHILAFSNYGPNIAEVEIPEGELIIPMSNKYKAHSIILKNIRKTNVTVWKELMAQGVDFKQHGEALFRRSCREGDLELAKWLFSEGYKSHPHYIFNAACENGYWEMARWLYEIVPIPINVQNEAFRLSCSKGHLEIARWLYQLGEIHLTLLECMPFRFACTHGQLEIAKWLTEKLNPEEIRNLNLFSAICNCNQLEVAKWFQESFGMPPKKARRDAFRYACSSGRLEMAQWIYSLGEVHIHERKEAFFRKACKYGHLEMAQWIYNLGGVDAYREEDCIFLQTHYSEQKEIITWLQNLETNKTTETSLS